MLRKYLFWVTLFALLAMHPIAASANVLESATATMRCACNRSTISVSAADLTVGTDYVINYTVKVTPISGPAITVSSQILFTATASIETVSAKNPAWGLTPRYILAERLCDTRFFRKYRDYQLRYQSSGLFDLDNRLPG
jgi:hypothetical protein